MTGDPSKTPAAVFLILMEDEERDQIRIQLTRSGIRVHSYQTVREFLLDRQNLTDSVVLTEFRLPGMTGIDLFDFLRNLQPPVPVVLIAEQTDAPAVIRKSSAEFLIRPVDGRQLKEAVLRAANGEEIDRSELQSAFASITDSEYEFLEFVVDGESSRDIAARLATSTSKVETYRTRIMNKSRAENLPHLVRMWRAWLGGE